MMGATTLTSLEEYERLPDDGIRYEIDEGELVPVTFPKRSHTRLQRRIQKLLSKFGDDRGTGEVYCEAPYLLSAQPPTLRAPDVSILAAERAESPEEGYTQGAPELAIEIMSPSNTPGEMDRRVGQYLAAGAWAVWVVYPKERKIRVYERGAAAARVLRNGDTIDGIGPLAGFSALVSSFFDEPRRG